MRPFFGSKSATENWLGKYRIQSPSLYRFRQRFLRFRCSGSHRLLDNSTPAIAHHLARDWSSAQVQVMPCFRFGNGANAALSRRGAVGVYATAVSVSGGGSDHKHILNEHERLQVQPRKTKQDIHNFKTSETHPRRRSSRTKHCVGSLHTGRTQWRRQRLLCSRPVVEPRAPNSSIASEAGMVATARRLPVKCCHGQCVQQCGTHSSRTFGGSEIPIVLRPP